MAPISVRGDKEGADLGNQVSAMLVQLGTHIADPEERILAIATNTKEQKALTKALGARQMAELSATAPALFTGIAARLYTQFGLANSAKPFFNTVVTNVPGPPIPIYSAGAEMVKYFGLLCLFDGLGLGHVVMSYHKEVTITITADRNMMPDPEFYADCLRESYEELERAILGSVQKVPTAKKAKAKSASPKKPATRKKAPAKSAKPKKRAARKTAPTKLKAVEAPENQELPLQEKAS
jgi:hypothetical protein